MEPILNSYGAQLSAPHLPPKPYQAEAPKPRCIMALRVRNLFQQHIVRPPQSETLMGFEEQEPLIENPYPSPIGPSNPLLPPEKLQQTCVQNLLKEMLQLAHAPFMSRNHINSRLDPLIKECSLSGFDVLDYTNGFQIAEKKFTIATFAAQYCNWTILDYLANEREDLLKQTDPEGYSPATRLLQARTPDQDTPQHIQDVALSLKILEKNNALSVSDDRKYNAFTTVLAPFNSWAIKALIESRLSLDEPDIKGRRLFTELLKIQRKNSVVSSFIPQLLEPHLVNPTLPDEEGTPPIVLTIRAHDLPSFQELLKSHANINQPTAQKDTPFIVSIREKNDLFFDALMRAQANIRTPDGTGQTPLEIAKNVGYTYGKRKLESALSHEETRI